ncbi:MAG: hypothetical protein OSB65_14845 [Roseibacillus sp.]|nr:hypothetical protein [Roseibacillus sp.]
MQGKIHGHWFNPRGGGALQNEATRKGGGKVTLKAPDAINDWLVIVRG